MATTLSTDLYRPEVWAALARKEYTGKLVVGTSPAVLTDDTLVGQPGDRIRMPKWMLLADTAFADLSENVAMVPHKLTQESSQVTIKEAGMAVEWTDTADLTGIGNIQDEALTQFGDLAARKIDTDLIAAATQVIAGGITYADGTAATASAPKTANAPGGFTWATIVDISLTAFGDDFDPSQFAGLYIRSEQAATMLKDDDFIRAAQGQGSNSIVNRGLLGTYMGLSVYLTNRLASNKALLLKNRSLGLFYKRRPIVERDRDILRRSTVTTTNVHYGVRRVKDDGVVDITITAAP